MIVGEVIKGKEKTELNFTLGSGVDEIEITIKAKNKSVFGVLKQIAEALEK